MNVSGIVMRLGGPAALATKLGLPGNDRGAKRIRAWARRGSIPSRYWLALIGQAELDGVPLSLDLIAAIHGEQEHASAA